ncbi:GAP family protein [Microbacterium sp. NPDC057659]|uniref:GAP family protein n=1 Tax=Microbacterium sp. NPDC057659 TaxID=3346198 RepID=UPI00366D29C1
MGDVIGQILPQAVGVAISPIPIIAAILMLLSPKARVTSVGFLLGWVLGIVIATTVFTLLSSVLPQGDDGGSKPIQGIIQLLLGAGLLLLAIGQWRKRPKDGEEPAMPKWMQAIDKITFPVALGLGFLLSAVNPKNLLMTAGAGVTIGSASLSGGDITLVIAIFTIIAASTVLIPVIGYLFAAEKLRGTLDAMRVWLTKENAVIMAVLLLVIGVQMIGKGIGSF